jgi:SAM-dependent methyltransferase
MNPTRTFGKSDLRPHASAVLANCYKVAFRALAGGHIREGLRLLMASVGYWRYWPNAVVAKLTPAKNAAILDVSSPKVLSLYLASRGHALTATDLDDAKIFSRWQKLARYSGPGSYKAEYQDARHLAYPDNSFDIVYSISVIEHIPDRGDAEALEEFGRVLRPGGHVIVEVPYRHQGRDYFFDYDSKGARLENPQFYERHYDAKTLRERLMNPAGLKLAGVLYQGERRAVDPWIATRRLPRILRTLVLPFEPVLASWNMWVLPEPSGERPLAAILIFQKG